MFKSCFGPPLNGHNFSSNDYFPHQRRSYTFGALHSSGDGSDGYASDPSRLSTSAFSPQQSPTPPVNQILDSMYSVPDNRCIQKHLNSLPDRIPPDNCSYLVKHFSESHGSCPSWISQAASFTNNCNTALQTVAPQLRDRCTCMHGVDCRCGTPQGQAGLATASALPRTRNFSVPANLVDRATLLPLLGCSSTKFPHEQELYQSGSAEEFCTPVCLPCDQNASITEGLPPQHLSSVRFVLDDFEDTRGIKDSPGYDSMKVTDELNHNPDFGRIGTGNVPSICLEGASNSSSSRSPSLEPKTSGHSVSSHPHCSFQAGEFPSEMGWDFSHLLSVPRLRPSTSASVRPPWPRVCQSFNMVSVCPNMHQNTATYQSPAAAMNYDMMKEFNRMRQKIHMLEYENALLQKNSRRTSLESNVQIGSHEPSDSMGPTKTRDRNVTVKRSTSLQVPKHEKRMRPRGPINSMGRNPSDSNPPNNST